jgi:hypothetical protein
MDVSAADPRFKTNAQRPIFTNLNACWERLDFAEAAAPPAAVL